MKTWRDNRVMRINTAKGLAQALSFNLGLKNCIIQLVELDRNRLEGLQNIFSGLVNQCGEYYSRVNSIKFHKGCNNEWNKMNPDYILPKYKNKLSHTRLGLCRTSGMVC